LKKENYYHFQTFHVPKTIDNDLPLRTGKSHFVFIRKDEGSGELALLPMKTHGTSEKLVRKCPPWEGLQDILLLELQLSCHFPMMVILKCQQDPILTFDKVVPTDYLPRWFKRKIQNINYGVALK